MQITNITKHLYIMTINTMIVLTMVIIITNMKKLNQTTINHILIYITIIITIIILIIYRGNLLLLSVLINFINIVILLRNQIIIKNLIITIAKNPIVFTIQKIIKKYIITQNVLAILINTNTTIDINLALKIRKIIITIMTIIIIENFINVINLTLVSGKKVKAKIENILA